MVAFSPDDSRVAVGGTALSLYDVATHRLLWRDDGLRINAIAFSPDGTTITAGGALPIVAAYDAATGGERWRVNHGSIVMSIAVSPNGRIAASGSDGGGVRLWQVPSGIELPHLRIPKLGPGTHMQAALDGYLAHEGHVPAVGFTGNGLLLTGAGDGSMRLWNPLHGRMLDQYVCATAVDSIAIDGARAVAPCFENGPALFDLPDLHVARYFGENNGGASAVLRASNGWVVEGNDGTIKSWNRSTFAIRTVSGSIASSALSPRGDRIAYSYGDRIVHVASTSSLRDIAEIDGVAWAPYRCCMGRPYLVLAMAGDDVIGDSFSTSGFVDHHGAYDGVLGIWNLDGRKVERYNGITASQIFAFDGGKLLILPTPAMTDTAWNVAIVNRQSKRYAVWQPQQTVSDRLQGLDVFASALPVLDGRPAVFTQSVIDNRLVVTERALPSGRALRTWRHTFSTSIHGMVQDRQSGDIAVAGKDDGLTILQLRGSIVALNSHAFERDFVMAMDAGGGRIAVLLQPDMYRCDGSYHLRTFSVFTAAPIAPVNRPGCAQNVQISADGRVLAVQTARGIDIWRLR